MTPRPWRFAIVLGLFACGGDTQGEASDGPSSTASTAAGSSIGHATTSPATSVGASTEPGDGSSAGGTGNDGPMPLPPHCGDGVQDPGEDCDDGNLLDHDACTNVCRAQACGDGILQDGEQCDDGNGDVLDDCAECRFAYCGDGFVRRSEACDDGNDDDDDACVGCENASCGDGSLQTGVEECDGVELGGQTCVTLGFMGGGTLVCDGMCELDTSSCCEIMGC